MPILEIPRREFLRASLIVAVSGLLAGCGALSRGLQPRADIARASRVGWIGASAEASTANREAFKDGLRSLGYVEGQNIVIDGRFSDGHDDRFVSPGGNVTGLNLGPLGGLDAKRLEILQSIVPEVARVAILGNAGNDTLTSSFERLREAGQRLGIQVSDGHIRGADDLEPMLDGAVRAGVQAVMVQNDPVTSSLRTRILSLAAQKRVLLTSGERLFVEGGALMGYGVSQTDVYRRAATFVDKILKGAKPGELPVEQPATFEFVVNERTARAFGLTIPDLVLAQATEVIR